MLNEFKVVLDLPFKFMCDWLGFIYKCLGFNSVGDLENVNRVKMEWQLF